MPAPTIAICSAVAVHVELADRAHRGLRRGRGPRGSGSSPRAAAPRSEVSKPNFSACARSASSPSVDADRGERGVARDRQRVLAAWSCRRGRTPCRTSCCSSLVVSGQLERWPGPARPVVGVYSPDSSAAAAVTSLNVEPGRQRHDERPVEQRLARVVVVGVVGLADRRRVVAAELVGVERRRRRHREDRAGARVDRDDRAGAAREPVVRRLLRLRVEREPDRAALDAATGEQLLHAVDEEAVVGAGEHGVLGALDAGGAVDERVEAGGRRVERAVGVAAQVLELVVGRDRRRDRRSTRAGSARARGRTPRAARGCCPAGARMSAAAKYCR